ncbi:MAG TPA: hypothetical protein VNL14_07685 [Candidatus Acidoferrales bacterium]|nr:hypothetical protein [Candidatus Acidoferrales bacterium]
MTRIAATLIVSLLLGGCRDAAEQSQADRPASKELEKYPVRRVVSETFERQQKKDYEIQLKALRDRYAHNIEELKHRFERSGSEMSEELARSVRDLEQKTARVDAMRKKLEAANLESWQELKPEIHAALDHLEAAYYGTLSQMVYVEEQRRAKAAHPGGPPDKPRDVVSVNMGQR